MKNKLKVQFVDNGKLGIKGHGCPQALSKIILNQFKILFLSECHYFVLSSNEGYIQKCCCKFPLVDLIKCMEQF